MHGGDLYISTCYQSSAQRLYPQPKREQFSASFQLWRIWQAGLVFCQNKLTCRIFFSIKEKCLTLKTQKLSTVPVYTCVSQVVTTVRTKSLLKPETFLSARWFKPSVLKTRTCPQPDNSSPSNRQGKTWKTTRTSPSGTLEVSESVHSENSWILFNRFAQARGLNRCSFNL